MSISDVASLVGGAFLGAPVSEGLKLVIEGAKKVKDFKPLFEDLASTMERLLPIINDIVSMQGRSTTGTRELEFLTNTVQRAEEMICKCSRVQWYNVADRFLYTRKIQGITRDVLKFTQVDLQFILLREQQHFRRSLEGMIPKMDLSDTRKELSETFIVPEPKELDVSWLDRPFRKLKMMLLEDGEVTLVVVSAPSACGKTTLVTKLCHDTDVKGKFKHIFFITVSKNPNTSIMVNILLQHTCCKANKFEKILDARLCIEQLLKQLGPSGSILVVLDDVWPEEKYFVEKFLIQLKDYKILVTSRFEFPSLGPTFLLEGFISEDVKNLFTECTPQPDSLSCANRSNLLQKIFNCGNGLPFAVSPPCSICEGCNSVIEDGCLVNVLGVLWHPDCFCCDACHKPISTDEIGNHVSNRRGKFHKSCYWEMRHPTCVVCKEKIPSTAEGIKCLQHPFWEGKYCPSHEVDGTSKCFSCERLEPTGTNYVKLCDGRWLCLECMDSAIMDTYACHLHFEIREFFEGLNMKIEKDFPVSLVEYEVLNGTLEEERGDLHTKVVIRGICLSEELIISSDHVGDMVTETRMLSGTEVTAILILYGLPRLLTGYILAHQMMHAYLRLNGYRNLDIHLEEGICQVLGLMWLESQTDVTTDATAASSSHTPPATTSKTGKWSDFEKKLVEFCKDQIKTEESPVIGVGFRKVHEMVRNSSLQDALEEIIRQG